MKKMILSMIAVLGIAGICNAQPSFDLYEPAATGNACVGYVHVFTFNTGTPRSTLIGGSFSGLGTYGSGTYANFALYDTSDGNKLLGTFYWNIYANGQYLSDELFFNNGGYSVDGRGGHTCKLVITITINDVTWGDIEYSNCKIDGD